MALLKRIILIVFPLFILGCFVVFWAEPRFNLWQMDKSIVRKKQSLPLMMMFSLPHEDGRFLVTNAQPQFVLAGPDLTLFYGAYVYKLEIEPACSGKSLGFMDVVRQKGSLGLGAREIIAAGIGQTQTESVEFEAENFFDYEFRLFSRGECPFEIRKAWIEKENLDFKAFGLVIWQSVRKVL